MKDDCDKNELLLLVNPNAINLNDKKSTIKKNFHDMSSGSMEDALLWTKNVYYIVKNNPCTSPESKFDIAKCLLSEETIKEGKIADSTDCQ